jgi:uncharacterized protein with von Willebrand factor type A (vWA) domain
MFEGFFYQLRARGFPISPTSFLRLQKALDRGLIADLDDFYAVARAVMIKSERQFDDYDQIFAAYFLGKEIDDRFEEILSDDLRALLDEWLADPLSFPLLDEETRDKLKEMSPDELVQYFKDRLADQTERHDGGGRWIGTGGTSPVGHGGDHPGGMRVGGRSGGRSAIKVAMDRRYIDYSDQGTITPERIGDAMASLKMLRPAGPRDTVDVEETIRETVRQGGEIELVFSPSLRDKLKIILMFDNGGWSMLPHIDVCRSLFTHARNQFKQVKFFYFHNCIYDHVWADPRRHRKPQAVEDLLRWEKDWRLLIVGDASMSPWELTHPRGAIDWTAPQSESGLTWLNRLRERFEHSAWINPIAEPHWRRVRGAETIAMTREIFPMYDLTLKGLERAVGALAD